MATRRKVETTETRSGFTIVFEDGFSGKGQCTIKHLRQMILSPDGEWVPGSHDVEVVCDEDLPIGTFGKPARITVEEGHALVGTDTWIVYPSSRRTLAYGGD